MAVVRRDRGEPGRPGAEREAEGGKRDSWVGWFVGWVVMPGLVLAGIVGSGMHLGANNPKAWYARAVLWISDLF